MTNEKMNIHKALCELKILDNRIRKETTSLNSIGVTKKVAQMVGSLKVDDFVQAAKEQYDKISDLIARRAAIKKAVVLSNAQTTVVIGGKQYTVAEAIEMKNHGMEGKRSLLTHLSNQLLDGERRVQNGNEKADRDADAYVQTVFGGKDNKSSANEIAAAREAYLNMQLVEIVDTIGVRKLINDLDDEISAFMTEVDAALSVSNANTEIEINY